MTYKTKKILVSKRSTDSISKKKDTEKNVHVKDTPKIISPENKNYSGPTTARKQNDLSRRKLLEHTDLVNTDLIVCDDTERSLQDTSRKDLARVIGETT